MIFCRQLLLDLFSSRENLFKRKVIVDPNGFYCVLYGGCLESASHLFITCSLAFGEWLGFLVVIYVGQVTSSTRGEGKIMVLKFTNDFSVLLLKQQIVSILFKIREN